MHLKTRDYYKFPGRIDIKTMEHVDIIRAITLFVETCWNKMDNVRNGQVLIADFSGYNWSIMTRYTISQKITMINMFWVTFQLGEAIKNE